KNGLKAWIYRYVSPTTKKRGKIFLGNYPVTGLADAYELWRETEAMIAKGIDPQENRKQSQEEAQQATTSTFEHFAGLYFS
ncbi:integrase arm-type DNA-binding domain-containing protein, partial [Mycobacterium tuberculosis]|nr:integrase arm-type DNA-binding domain-containing protein [Mycobacterium tuberculosis]